MKPSDRGITVEAAVVAGCSAALVAMYGLRGGAYDPVIWGQLAVLTWVALGLGWAFGVLPVRTLPRALWPALAGFAGLAVWTLVCLRWTESDERTVVELGRVAHHAGVLLLAASVLRRRTWRAALGGVALGLVVVTWLGLLNWLWPGSIGTDYTRQVFGAQRLSYPLAYFNGMATLGAMTLVVGLGLAAHARSGLLRALVVLPLPGVAVMTYLTYSRGGALELAAGLVILVACARNRISTALLGLVVAAGSTQAILALRDHRELVTGTGSDGAGQILVYALLAGAVAAGVAYLLRATGSDASLRLPRRIGVPIAAGAGVIVLLAAAIAGPSIVRKASDSFDKPVTSSADNPTARFTSLGGNRLPQFKAAIAEWKRHRVEGTGPGTYEFTWNRSRRYNEFVRDVHNLYLEALSESGIPGLVAILAILGGLAAVALTAVRRAVSASAQGGAAVAAAVLAVFAVGAAVDWVWELTALPFVLFATTGAAAAAIGGGARRAWRVPPGRVVVPIAAVLAVAALLPPLVSRSEIRASQAAARAGQPAVALARADDAIGAAPWSASAPAQKALLLEDAGRLAAAESYAVLAARHEPTNWRYALMRARLRAKRGDTSGALRQFAIARRLAPRKAALRVP